MKNLGASSGTAADMGTHKCINASSNSSVFVGGSVSVGVSTGVRASVTACAGAGLGYGMKSSLK